MVSRLRTTRLLTLTGAGGCGKTRLALAAAAEAEPPPADGTWLFDLSSLSDPSQILPGALSALGVREEPGRRVPWGPGPCTSRRLPGSGRPGNKHHLARALHSLGNLARSQGDHHEAQAAQGQALRVNGQGRDRGPARPGRALKAVAGQAARERR